MEYWNALLAVAIDSPIAVGAVVLAVTNLVLITWVLVRLHGLTKGGDGKSLEATITKLGERTAGLEKHAATTEAALENVDQRLSSAIRGVSVERFDPFANAGGQQSFASALLNEAGDGIVLSGIHARDGVRVYAKSVTKFTSERELSEEESRAITSAKTKLG